MFMSSISRWRNGLIEASRTGWGMVRLLVEEACDAPPLPNRAQSGRDDGFMISTSTAGARPAQRVRSAAPEKTE